MLLVRNFYYLTKTPRKSFLETDDRYRAHTRRPRTPHKERTSISQAVVAREELAVAVRKSSANVQLGVVFRLVLGL